VATPGAADTTRGRGQIEARGIGGFR
jgi:hypothetical protein